jgi:hypothetical protein
MTIITPVLGFVGIVIIGLVGVLALLALCIVLIPIFLLEMILWLPFYLLTRLIKKVLNLD